MANSDLIRIDGRRADELRPVTIHRSFIKHAEGSVLIEMGATKVICTVSVEEKVPPFLRGQNRGWVTAEYAMIPRATPERVPREASKGKQGGRTLEIQRLIGRSLRAVTNMDELGERTFWVDCDVIQADGGTRTASVTGAFVALADAIAVVRQKGLIKKNPLKDYLAAVSVGKVGADMFADLCYAEDCIADVDLNLIMTGKGEFVEVQGTAERVPFSRAELQKFLDLGWTGIQSLIKLQQDLLGELR
jgi:ribonuclease PH